MGDDMEIKAIHVALIGLVFLLGHFAGLYQIPGLPSLQATQTEQPGEQLPPADEYVSVTRPLDFSVVDKYAGSAVGSATVKVYDGTQLLESLTTASDGTISTSRSYPSGKKLNILVTKSNSKCWYTITVPKMLRSDVDSLSTNPVALDFFTLDTSVTLKVLDSAGNVYTNNGNYNWTSRGVTQETLTISGYVSTDNRGFLSSYDPLNNLNWKVVLYGKLTGTNYEYLTMTGWDDRYERGSAMWHAAVIPDVGVTKWKVGDEYVYSGSFSKTVTFKKGSYSGDAADLVLYLYAYSDPAYHEDIGSFGPDAVAMCSAVTINIVD